METVSTRVGGRVDSTAPRPAEQERLSNLPGVTVYTLESALTEEMYLVFEYFLRETNCEKMCGPRHGIRSMEVLPRVFEGLAVAVPRFCEDHKILGSLNHHENLQELGCWSRLIGANLENERMTHLTLELREDQ